MTSGAHQDDVENIPVFIVLAFLFLLASPSAFIANMMFRTNFTFCRDLHSIILSEGQRSQAALLRNSFSRLSICVDAYLLNSGAAVMAKEFEYRETASAYAPTQSEASGRSLRSADKPKTLAALVFSNGNLLLTFSILNEK
ncbi:hypothetical protein E2C01_048877 [Portunus trituberculatus]|uniref:Uncharacterized protein n=1 Tax=Portunus trituberculatus TaxID=210409 RepID=A0A5B7GCQ3_PORTR|nr:hypothetical protein [Portunus trituberculatus]